MAHGCRDQRWGRPVRYAFLTRHPGVLKFKMLSEGGKHFLPAEDVIHLFIPERASSIAACRGFTL